MDIKTELLKIIKQQGHKSMQSTGILSLAQMLLKNVPDQAILTSFYDLFRSGILSWGHDFANPDPPFFHLSEQGRSALENITRDPNNPTGYMSHLSQVGNINPISESYIKEALETYNNGCFKASAVMVGCATESLVLELRESIISRLNDLNENVPNKLKDWKVKLIIRGIENVLRPQKDAMSNILFESFEAYWVAFIHQIRTVRNDTGHPTSIEPVNQDTVHASLLVFPELAKLTSELTDWISQSLQ